APTSAPSPLKVRRWSFSAPTTSRSPRRGSRWTGGRRRWNWPRQVRSSKPKARSEVRSYFWLLASEFWLLASNFQLVKCASLITDSIEAQSSQLLVEDREIALQR